MDGWIIKTRYRSGRLYPWIAEIYYEGTLKKTKDGFSEQSVVRQAKRYINYESRPTEAFVGHTYNSKGQRI